MIICFLTFNIYTHSTEFINTREEGKALIKEIALKRIEFKSVGGSGNGAGGMDDKDSAATEGGVNTDEPKQQVFPLANLFRVDFLCLVMNV